jgi:carbon catabolite-derepressing protein kinase
MLAVDPVKRITVPEIIQHPFFQVDLPRYLQPLPPPPGPVLGTLSALVTPGKAIDFEIIDGLGRIEEDVVEELALRMEGIDKEDVWECLRREDGTQGNAVKVAYMLLRDKRRLGRDRKLLPFYVVLIFIGIPVAAYEEQERDARLAALDVRPLLVIQPHLLILHVAAEPIVSCCVVAQWC